MLESTQTTQDAGKLSVAFNADRGLMFELS
jgi:hypothetical protein